MPRDVTGHCLAPTKTRLACITEHQGYMSKTGVPHELWGIYDAWHPPWVDSNYQMVRRGPKEVGRQTVIYFCLTDRSCPFRTKEKEKKR